MFLCYSEIAQGSSECTWKHLERAAPFHMENQRTSRHAEYLPWSKVHAVIHLEVKPSSRGSWRREGSGLDMGKCAGYHRDS